MKKSKRLFLWVAILVSWITLLGLAGCISDNRIKIAFVAELTGKESELGVHERNGVQLAVEEINQSGGINGRKIDLLIEDDLGIPGGAQKADKKVIDNGAIAIIGHFTSNQTVEGYKVAEAHGVVMVSPTAATSFLSGKKDLFFRVIPSTDMLGKEFARYIYKQRRLSRLVIIYDLDNLTYSEPMALAFSKQFTELGGQLATQVNFSGKSSPDFSPLVQKLQTTGSDGVFIIAAPNNAASIAQSIRLAQWNVPLFAAPWAQGVSLIQNGGKAVEGMELLVPFDINASTPELEAFRERYMDRFAITPAYTAMYGYEAAQILAEALKKSGGEAKGLPEGLLAIKNFHGLIGELHMDPYGDIFRGLYIQQVKDNKFVTILTLKPE
jgi:branched-chain amino acid transport system substrate-binding protein